MAVRNLEATNQRIAQAQEYLAKHQVLELFEDLTTLLVYDKPTDVRAFLIQELRNRKVQGPAGHVIFSDQELRNVFTLFDLRQRGQLSQQQCVEALKTLANSRYQFEHVDKLLHSNRVPDTVDVDTFLVLSKAVLAGSL
mmetsp:Transcript_14961/g.27610  ORF Transcript_14961/g.27610 Transcript_14961/m.27610 type:complete len:139 (+) Transcript_14961:39-455(+)